MYDTYAMQKALPYIADSIKILLIAGCTAFLLHHFVAEPVFIRDNSMAPDFNRGDIVIVRHVYGAKQDLSHGEVIAIRTYSGNPYKTLRKVVALPLEEATVSDGILTIRGEEVVNTPLQNYGAVSAGLVTIGRIDRNEYYVLPITELKMPMGLLDSRYIFGKPIFKIWPQLKIIQN